MAGRRSKLEVPPIWVWIAEQTLNDDPEIAAAAKEISSRWNPGPWYNHAKVMRALTSEESQFLHGAHKLTDLFAEYYDINPRDQAESVGVVSPMIPVTREQCGHFYARGRQCQRDAVPGAGMCSEHGGSWITESERVAVVNQVSQKMVDIADRAVRVLAETMDNAKSEKVRVDAALAILDRVGVGPVSKIEFDVTPAAEKAGEEIRARLLKLAPKPVEDGEEVHQVTEVGEGESA